jgi:hypothetical protein
MTPQNQNGALWRYCNPQSHPAELAGLMPTHDGCRCLSTLRQIPPIQLGREGTNAFTYARCARKRTYKVHDGRKASPRISARREGLAEGRARAMRGCIKKGADRSRRPVSTGSGIGTSPPYGTIVNKAESIRPTLEPMPQAMSLSGVGRREIGLPRVSPAPLCSE